MRVRHVGVTHTRAASEAGRVSLTPELLASVGARYSRSGDGLDKILSKVDHGNQDASIDAIFRMVDYGHRSIADMAPVAMFLDGISVWAAFQLFNQAQTAAGQETSSRYFKFSVDDLPDHRSLGIPDKLQWLWSVYMQEAFSCYHKAYELWDSFAQTDPSVCRLPEELLQDNDALSYKQQKQKERMVRNYAFDRARYFLPAAATTNVVLVQSALSWVQLIQFLLSHYHPEFVTLGNLILSELGLVAPRLVRHAVESEELKNRLREELGIYAAMASTSHPVLTEASADPFLEIHLPERDRSASYTGYCKQEAHKALLFRDNRYSPSGSYLSRMSVRFGWSAVALGEARDLNRHRTGTRYIPPVAVGFYGAKDQLPEFATHEQRCLLDDICCSGSTCSEAAREMASYGDDFFPYCLLMGTQTPFEHLTTGDKFVYEAELRTGAGAHFRYAKHFHDLLPLFYAALPETQGRMFVGTAEPE